ncbi:MAG: hypothetical protein A2297_05490 [Elusimicrobia bacterium RIFOXYB2_FULL_48_7]|nr:MAG: hypothetical protein A2297_05490 [Elusimicrobia bacterium RIFOXYB2_FULL_48_7]
MNITDDSTIESSEPIYLALGTPTGGAELGNIKSTVLYIIDNDSVAAMAPNPIISHGKTVYASADTANASKVVDGIYSISDIWSPGPAPAWIAVNIGASAGYTRLYLAWNNTVNYDYGLASDFYGPSAYTLQTSADSTNGADGTWSTVATVTGNIYRTRENSFDFTGKSWVKMNITAVSQTPWGIDEIDIHDVSNGCADTVFFLGDSITQRAFRRTSTRLPSYADDVKTKHSTYYPAMIGGGYGGTTAAGWKSTLLEPALAANPDMKYWCIGLGFNDIAYACHTSTAFYSKSLQNIIDRIKIAGHIPVLAKITWGTSPMDNFVAPFNQAVDALTAENALMQGPDLWTAFLNHTEYLEDTVHPNPAGSIVMNQKWADALDSLYTGTGTITDTTPPSAPAQVRDGTGSDVSSAYTLSANWDTSADAESAITKYQYAIGTTPGGTDVRSWTDNTTTAVTPTGLSVTAGTVYYFTVKSVNGAGLASTVANSNGQTILSGVSDTTPPANIAAVRDGTGADTSATTSNTRLSANWDACTDTESGITKYLYAIGMTPGGANIVGWTDNTTTAVTKTGLTLTVGTTYYFSVKSENGVGLQSTATNSNGQYITAAAIPAGEVNAYPNPYSIASGKPVKFAFSGSNNGDVSIYTTSGRLVKKLSAAAAEVSWDGANETGEKVKVGLYVYCITDGSGNKKTGKLLIK